MPDDRRRGGHRAAARSRVSVAGSGHAKFAGRVSDSGEGRCTVDAAIDEGVPAPIISAAQYARFSSRGENAFADKLLSAMRYEFGGHVEKNIEGQ